MTSRLCLALSMSTTLSLLACGGDDGSAADAAGSETGDGDPSGDGDGDPSGDGDGDPSGDGDGDPSGDGDGDPSGDGDGDPSGDGDGDPSGDGDGDPGFDFDCSEGLDPVILTLMGGQSARYPTIADAVFAAPDGATVQICPGMYTESEVLVDDDIEIQGAGPGATVWAPAAGGALILDAVDVVVRDLTITGGSGIEASGYNGTCGGAIFVADDFNVARAVLLANLELLDNSAELGGALCIDGGSNGQVPTVTIEGSTISGNTAELQGGGIHAYGRFHLVDSAVVDNVAELQGGGGIAANYGCRTVEQCSITDSAVHSNTAAVGMWHNGGGLWLSDFSTNNGKQGAAVTVTNSDFGFGAEQENEPDDVTTIFELTPTSYGFYANGVSFTCDDGLCTDP